MLNFHLVLTIIYVQITGSTFINITPNMLPTSDDPSETRDLSAMFPDVVLKLEKMIDSERQNVVEQIRPTSLTANPSNFNGFWSPGWC